MSGEVDLVEVVHTGTGGSLVSKRRFWLNDELLEVERCEPGRRFYGDGVCVVESFFGSSDLSGEWVRAEMGGGLQNRGVRNRI